MMQSTICPPSFWRNTGVIRTREVLDREKIAQIPFSVVALNDRLTGRPGLESPQQMGQNRLSNLHGPNEAHLNDSKAETSVVINLIDINDNPPLMVPIDDVVSGTSVAIASASSQTPAELIFTLDRFDPINPCLDFPYTFVDADEGRNAEVVITLEENAFFWLQAEHNLLCVKPVSPAEERNSQTRPTSESSRGNESVRDGLATRPTATLLPAPGRYILYLVARDNPENATAVLRRQYQLRVIVRETSPDSLPLLFSASSSDLASAGTAAESALLKANRRSEVSGPPQWPVSSGLGTTGRLESQRRQPVRAGSSRHSATGDFAAESSMLSGPSAASLAAMATDRGTGGRRSSGELYADASQAQAAVTANISNGGTFGELRSITVVAVLVSLAGILCLVLLMVVISLKRCSRTENMRRNRAGLLCNFVRFSGHLTLE
ncbi:unnamed protein product [Protopolystoma xenopodis]|uniref:Cadherin domain-containing protein n=1 Tax=Protopolystoma xenopodis TaxID=117903 RepID=A0A3S5CHE4_9PLAT|nr:unnamed protein product [Protopolystoma xenopodis]